MNRAIVALASMLAACSGAAEELAVAEIGLAPAPESVESVSIFVLQDDEVVASATIPPSRTTVQLGVPAEVPLEFHVVARTDLPGPPGVGKMPSHAGTVVRAVPLRRDPERVAITAHPAGVLTVRGVPMPEEVRDERVTIELEEERPEGAVIRFRVPREPIDLERALILRSGRYRARIAPQDPDDLPRWRIDAAEGLFVARETESIWPLSIVPLPEEPEAPLRLLLGILDDGPGELEAPDRVRVSRTGEARLALVAVVVDASGQSVPLPDVELRWRIFGDPPGVLRGVAGELEGDTTGLPATIEDFSARGTGRAGVEAEAVTAGGQRLQASLQLNVLEPGVEPGPAVALALRLADPERLLQGTELIIEIVDARGLLVRDHRGTVELGRTDPWIFLPEGPSAELRPEDRGFLRRRITRPSAPADRLIAVRATATSTLTGMVLTSTLTLPPL